MQSEQENDTPTTPPTGFVFHPGDTLEVNHDSQPTADSATPEPTPPDNTPLNSDPAPQSIPPATISTPVPATPQASAVTPEPQPVNEKDTVAWTASEFIAHQKGAEWHIALGLGAVILSGVVYLLTKDYIAAGMIVIVAFAFGIFAAKKPRVLQYRIDDNGISIGRKHYLFGAFKSFSVIDDSAAHSVLLTPMQRFMPSITMYYAPEDEEKILVKIADFLPFEEHTQDVVDRVMRRIRF